tara:strand:+ start:492 stop:995 length:504 start_codon:yes stop_codon:yes gene_type:complete
VFFKRHKRNSSLIRVDNSNEVDSTVYLRNRIKKIDLQIEDISKSIFNAQIVKVRSLLSGNRTFLGGLQQKLVQSSVSNSLEWHKQNLNEILIERGKLQDQLDKHTGQYWFKRIKKWLILISLWIFIGLICTIIIIGFMTALYLVPLLGLIALTYMIIKRLNLQINKN